MVIRCFESAGERDGSCLVGDRSSHVAAVIDPCCDYSVYIEAADQERMELRYVIQTQDGIDRTRTARELSRHCGAKLYSSIVRDECGECLSIREGDVIEFGTTRLTVTVAHGSTGDRHVILAFDLQRSDSEPVARFDPTAPLGLDR